MLYLVDKSTMSHESYFFIYDVLLLLFKVIDSKYTDVMHKSVVNV